MAARDLTVVIPTFRRPAQLADALDGCFAQRGVSDLDWDILVVDNSPEASAAAQTMSIARTAPVPVRCVHEARTGICHARNAGLEHARGNLLAFLDDDERPSPRWLHHLVATQRRSGADVVFAPVRAIPPPGLAADLHAFAAAFFTCDQDRPTGIPIGSTILTPPWSRRGESYPTLASGNVLIARTSASVRDVRFHPYYALNGGEDTLYFTELAARGARMVWCAEAVVTEDIPPTRLETGYLLRRAFRGGQGSGRVPLLMRPRRPLTAARGMAVGAAQVAVHAPLAVALWVVRSAGWRNHVHKFLSALGKVLWMVEIAPRYRPVPGAAVDALARTAASPARKPAPNDDEESPRPPALSVLIPFHADDPVPLVRGLLAEARQLREPVEIVLLDDATPDAALAARIGDDLRALGEPVRLQVSPRNLGRAAARNALAGMARAPWLLYLDADMRVAPGFLARHLAAARDDTFDAAFGGYTAVPPSDPSLRLHAALAAASEMRASAARSRIGATAFCTSNLLVRAPVMNEIPFDEGFAGWGWEDVDWAVSASRAYRLRHIDNPAGHAGWQDPERLLAKFREAAENFRRALNKHPELARLQGARVAAVLMRLPGRAPLRCLFAALVRAGAMPMRVRVVALKLWRASWAGEALRQ